MVVEDGLIVRRAFGAELPELAESDHNENAPSPSAAHAALDSASHAAQIADLLAAVDAGRPPSVTAESGRAALEVVCAVYQSAREGRSAVIPVAAAEDPGAAVPG